MQAVSLRFSPALWRRGRGANLKPRLSQAASLATERPPRNMRLSLHPSLPRESTYKPLRDFGVGAQCEFPQGLKSVCENSTKHLLSSGQLRHKESMSRFKPYRPEQAYLLPPSVKDVLGAGHLCFFVQQVIGQLDLSRFEEQYSAEGGELYAVPLLLSVWLYAYATGLTSARELERRIREDLPLRYLAGGAQPDHWALSAFRRQHGRGINEEFTQTLELVRDAGLGKMGIVAVDSTPLAAHNSKQRVDTRQGLRQERAKYRRQVRHWQKQCDAAGAPVAAEYAAEQLQRVQQRLAELPKRLQALKKSGEARLPHRWRGAGAAQARSLGDRLHGGVG